MSGELVSMHDIATLAHVARPVVTVWRRRHRTSSRPFPSPRTQHDNHDLFSRDEVVAWLEETDHGNNPDARTEATVGALLSDPTLAAPHNLDALSALLVLRSLRGAPLTGLDGDGLLDAADTLDPDNTFLFREVEQADGLPWLVDAAERLIAASWSVTDAHQRLVAARLPALSARVLLGTAATRTMLALASPLLRELGPDASLLDPTGCRFDLMPELASATEAPLTLLDGNTRSHRLNRRRLRLAQVIPTLISSGSGWSATGPTLSVAVLPGPAHPAAAEESQLTLIEDVALQLTSDQMLLVLAPASTLTDPLGGPSGSQRDQLLRSGQVRAIVRLPAGMIPGRARESMALWLVTKADTTAPADRRTLVADLSYLALTAVVVDGLASDLLAASQGTGGARRRAWAHFHPLLTSSLLATNGSLVSGRPVTPSSRSGERDLSGSDWVVRLSVAAGEQLPGYELSVADGSPEQASLAQAERLGWVRVVRGRRFDADSLGSSPQASVRIWDAAAVASAQPPREVDRLELHEHMDPVFTEPGDVVFLNRPRPAARLDPDGGAAILAPVRILRARASGPLVPAVLAMRINAETSTNWRSWRFSAVQQPDALAAIHTELAARRAQLATELADLDRFTTDITMAVESGQLSLTLKENHDQAPR